MRKKTAGKDTESMNGSADTNEAADLKGANDAGREQAPNQSIGTNVERSRLALQALLEPPIEFASSTMPSSR